MKVTKEIHKAYKDHQDFFDDIVANYEVKGTPFGNQDRNSLRLFDLNGVTVNVKSFRIPNLINQVAYRFFRKSKAQRSFEYGSWLQSLEIGTPQPMAYYEYTSMLLFKNSYYISAHQDCDLTYRELTTDFEYPDHEKILRAFTRFTFKLHEKKVHFLDHSPGNTLIKREGNEFHFYLVDLNRMEFRALDFETRIKNFAKLTTHRFMIEIMSDEYAKCIGADYNKVFQLMWSETHKFQNRYHRRRRLKNKLKFWKKNTD